MCPHTPNERRCGALGAEPRTSSRRFEATTRLPRMVALAPRGPDGGVTDLGGLTDKPPGKP
jgi:hypothetical protein